LTLPATARLFIALGALAALLAVALGAFGAHGLKSRLGADMMAIYQTGVQYHFWHALGLVLVGLLAIHLPGSGALRAAGWLMAAGILVFSGSLYALALSGVRWLGAITPFGGLAFLAAWACLAWAALRG
jgi:uncharacterized membrane protein YgdD (TMEM256/DUF423 family)